MEADPNKTNLQSHYETDMSDEQWDNSGSNVRFESEITLADTIPEQLPTWSDDFRSEEGVSDEQRSIQ